MIVNPWTVSSLSLDGLSAGLGLITCGLAFRQLALSWSNKKQSGEQLARTEDRLYLLFWLGTVFLLLRFLAWPLFYFSLHSFISEISGAMCIFGARNLLPVLTRLLEVVKPLLFYAGFVWLMLFRLERFGSRTAGGMIGRRRGLLLLCLCSVIGLLDSWGSVFLWLRSDAELAVSCCTTITDIPTRFTVWIPESLFGPEYTRLLWFGYFVCNAAVVLSGIFIHKRLMATAGVKRDLFVLFLFVLINCVGGVFAYIEVIAPRLMALPFHHCLYCMMQNVLDAPVFVSLFILGNIFIAAVFPLWVLAVKWADQKSLITLVSRLISYGSLFLTGSVLMVVIHLLR